MYSIKVEASFSSAHNLRGYKGKCEALHGHNWKIEVAASKKKLDKAGMVLDFKFIKNQLNAVLEKLDHKYLNNIAFFKKVNPTSENIAKYIYDSLKPKVASIKSVTVWESENSSATYS
ncbi:MAG: 6-carboxytetrahydropterin synthase QueD [Omnitrophica WOR_2 bacterium RBG_13_41_10]|nr:MAG: 6-carboxytetrahydropterin synthase QueD [Omnitrophica WOR_2 bacterium RBG_13_41_10]